MQIKKFEARPYGERLTQHAKAGLTVPGARSTRPVFVEVLVDNV